ncbi:MAG: class I SAM-dependent methyltransferase [Rhodospirillales bacterium]|nr:class I SAM-dependent methyltransferase [Alphaproteobacteria bacterium]MCB1840536.1 class I SAM-dependent methyltransferase [Alphaproteobacteria bacterium]MCB9977143.1 class I SAM-dependent methyltransferase [Rhodospirillales bacterium]
MKYSFFEIITLRKDVRKVLQSYFDRYLNEDMKVYDIGCGDKPFASSLAGKVADHIGVDIEDGFYESHHIDLVGSAYNVPVEDGAGDAVISSQVIEHLDRPVDAIKETARVLKPGGLFLISFPFLYPIHAEPHDFTRFTEYAMTKLLNDHGFEIKEINRIGGFWYIAGMYLHMYLKTFDRGPIRKIKLVPAISWLLLWIITQIHRLEGTVMRAAGKDPDTLRTKWTVNYIFVARKGTQRT